MRRNFKDYGSLFIFLFWISSNNLLLPNSCDYHKKVGKGKKLQQWKPFDMKLRAW